MDPVARTRHLFESLRIISASNVSIMVAEMTSAFMPIGGSAATKREKSEVACGRSYPRPYKVVTTYPGGLCDTQLYAVNR